MVLKKVSISPKIHWKGFQVDQRCTAVFMQHRVKKKYQAKCAKTVIAYKMKTVHNNDFLEAILPCKTVISYTFGIMVIWDIFTSISENQKIVGMKIKGIE